MLNNSSYLRINRFLTNWPRLISYIFLLAIFCKDDNSGKKTLDTSADEISITKIDFFSTSGTKNGFHKDQYKKDINVRVSLNDVTEIKATLLNTQGFSKIITRSSNSDIFVLNSNGTNNDIELSTGDNFLTIYGNDNLSDVNTARIQVFGVNNLGEEFLFSGSLNSLDPICERNVHVFLFDKNEDKSTGMVLTDEGKQIFENLDLVLPRPVLSAGIFPDRFSLDDPEVGFLSIRNANHFRSQRGCGTCVFFSVIVPLEIEYKRHLIEDLLYPPTLFDINLSEMQLILLYNKGGNGADPFKVSEHLVSYNYHLPLERYNCYHGTNFTGNEDCLYDDFDIVNGLPGVGANSYEKICENEDDYDEFLIKYQLWSYHKPVRASIQVPDGFPNTKTFIDEKFGNDNTNHSVAIIGWDNDAEADGELIGDAWIIRNSWRDIQEFYLKMGEGYGNLRNLVVLGDFEFIDEEELISDLMDGNNADCSDGDVFPETWNVGAEGITSGIATQVTSQELLFNEIQYTLLINPSYQGGISVTAGKYIADVYKLTFHITLPMEAFDVDVFYPTTNTISAATVAPCDPYCFIESEGDGGADIVGYAVYLKTTIPDGVEINEWVITTPSASQVGYIYRTGGEFLGY